MLETPGMSDASADLVVRSRKEIAEGVVHLLLERGDGKTLPRWSPGAHVDLRLTADLWRQYSLCGSPANARVWEIAVLREPESRGGSRLICDELAIGSVVTVGGPRNHFALEPAPVYRFVAGGIGITPIIPMIEAAEQAGADWQLLYGGRTRASMAFASELQSKYGDRVLLRPQDEFGLLNLSDYFADLSDGGLVYCCGPEPLLEAVTAAGEWWPPGTLHTERFAPKPRDASTVDTEFEVELAQRGTTVVVPPGRSILEVVEEAGVFVMSSCSEGTCGSCETTVLDGEPDHRDSVLDEASRATNDSMMICVSRCKGARLVLDL